MKKPWQICCFILLYIIKVKMICTHESFSEFSKQTKQVMLRSWKTSQVKSRLKLSGMSLTSAVHKEKTMPTWNGTKFLSLLLSCLSTVSAQTKSLTQKPTASSFSCSTSRNLKTFWFLSVFCLRKNGKIQVCSFSLSRTPLTHTSPEKIKPSLSRNVVEESVKFLNCPIQTR